MQTDPCLLSNRIHSLKYLRSTTLGSKDIEIRNISLWTTCNSFKHSYLTEVIAWNIKSLQHQLAKIIICGEFLVLFVFFILLTKWVKSGISFSSQTTMKMFSEFMFWIKNIKYSKPSAEFFLTQTTRNKII